MTSVAANSHYNTVTTSRSADKDQTASENSDGFGALVAEGDTSPTKNTATASDVVTVGPVTTLQLANGETFVGQSHRVDFSRIQFSVAQQPEDKYQDYMSVTEETIETTHESLERRFELDYATVVSNGKMVARIDNRGEVISFSDYSAAINDLLPSVDGAAGPDLAQKRADAIAGLFGAKVVKSDAAMTQEDFDVIAEFDVDSPVQYQDGLGEAADDLLKMLGSFQNVQKDRADYLAQQTVTDVAL